MIFLFDSSSNSIDAGHENFYNESLVKVINQSHEYQIIKPFQNIRRNNLSRIIIFLITFFFFLKVPNKKENILILPSPSTHDTVTIFLLLFFKRIKIIYFKRRLFLNKTIKGKILNLLMECLYKKRNILFVSDSNLILKKIKSVNSKFKISIPKRKIQKFEPEEQINFLNLDFKPVFAFSGVMRNEKGIKLYDEIIDLTLDTIENSFFVVHGVYLDNKMKTYYDRLKSKYKQNNRTMFIDRFLTEEEYSWFVGAIDVMVLPYDVELYSSGTSGPMQETLSSGGSVISTKLEWAMDEFDEQNKIFWMDNYDMESYEESLEKFILKGYNNNDSQINLSTFKEDWDKTIKYAIHLS